MSRNPDANYTKVGNQLLETMYRYQCSALKKDILLYLIRESYGYQRNTAAVSIQKLASGICREKSKVGHALRELIDCFVLLVCGWTQAPHPMRILSINERVWEWVPAVLPAAGAESGSGAEVPEGIITVRNGQGTGAAEGFSGVDGSGHPNIAQTPVNKGPDSTPKKDLKKEKEIFMYDISNIPPALREVEGFREMFNKWCIYRQEICRPLTPMQIDFQLRKLLQYSSEGFSVIEIIERSVSAGWPDFYRPSVRIESGSHTTEYPGVEDN